MVLDYGWREDYYILLSSHQIALVLVVTRLPWSRSVDKRTGLVLFVGWRLVALSMIDLLPRLVHLD